MDYPQPVLITPEEANPFYCPFGCKAPECDDKGYCPHLVGFTTDREVLEPIEPMMRYNKEKGWYDSGFLTVNAAAREMVQPEDVIINPKVREKLPKSNQEYEKHLWVSFRVYTDNPDREPILWEPEVTKGIGPKNVNFQLKARNKRIEEQLTAPAPSVKRVGRPSKKPAENKQRLSAKTGNPKAQADRPDVELQEVN